MSLTHTKYDYIQIIPSLICIFLHHNAAFGIFLRLLIIFPRAEVLYPDA